jgi:hypothetical protein
MPSQTCQEIVGVWVSATMDMKTPPSHSSPENSGWVSHMETDPKWGPQVPSTSKLANGYCNGLVGIVY